MPIPTEPIGSIPRSRDLHEAMQAFAAGAIHGDAMERALDEAVYDTIEQLEAAGSPVMVDGEQAKPSF
ncbi:MAG: 5-methyltetrahydropteroyltriglutamate--homocysteine methyltransferase, partial [Gemmatimonas sp. SG8_28]